MGDEVHVSVYLMHGTLLGRWTVLLDDPHTLGAYAVPGGFVLTDSSGARIIPLGPSGEPLGEPLVLRSPEADGSGPPVVGRSGDGWAVAWVERTAATGQALATEVQLRAFGCAWPP